MPSTPVSADKMNAPSCLEELLSLAFNCSLMRRYSLTTTADSLSAAKQRHTRSIQKCAPLSQKICNRCAVGIRQFWQISKLTPARLNTFQACLIMPSDFTLWVPDGPFAPRHKDVKIKRDSAAAAQSLLAAISPAGPPAPRTEIRCSVCQHLSICILLSLTYHSMII